MELKKGNSDVEMIKAAKNEVLNFSTGIEVFCCNSICYAKSYDIFTDGNNGIKVEYHAKFSYSNQNFESTSVCGPNPAKLYS